MIVSEQDLTDAAPTTEKVSEADLSATAPTTKVSESDITADKPASFFDGVLNLAAQAKQKVMDAFAQQQQQAAEAQSAQAAKDADPKYWTAQQYQDRMPQPQGPDQQTEYDTTLKSKQDQEDQFRQKYFQQKYGFDPEKQHEEFSALMSPDVKIEAMAPKSFFDKVSDIVQKVYGSSTGLSPAGIGMKVGTNLTGSDTGEADAAQNESARKANIVNLSKYTGLNPSVVSKNYDSITQELGLRDYPNASEVISAGMLLGLPVSVEAMGPVAVAKGLAEYTAAKEGTERVLLPAARAVWEKLNDESVKYEVKQLRDYFPDDAQDIGTLSEFVLYGMGAKGIDDLLSTPEALKAGNRVMGELNGIRGRILSAMGVKMETGLAPITYEQAQSAFSDHWKDIVSSSEWNRYKSDLSEQVTKQNAEAETTRQAMENPSRVKEEDLQTSPIESYLSPNLKPEQQKEADFISNNYPAFSSAYDEAIKKEYNTKTPNIVSADVAKTVPMLERAPFQSDMSVDRHEGSSAFAKARYDDLLADPKTLDNPVMVMGGISGAGKTSSLRDAGVDTASAAAVYDTNMRSVPSADRIIQKALDSGRQVEVHYVDRDPLDAFKEGVFPRFLNHDEHRIVPIETHIANYDSREVIAKLVDKYKNNSDVDFFIYDNNHGKGQGSLVDIDNLPSKVYTPNEIRNNLHDYITKQYNELQQTPQREIFNQRALRTFTGAERSEAPGARGQNGPRDVSGIQRPSPQAGRAPKSVIQFTEPEKNALGGLIEDIQDMEAKRRLPVENNQGEIKTLVTGYVPDYLSNIGVTKAKDIPILQKALTGSTLTELQAERAQHLIGRWADEMSQRYQIPVDDIMKDGPFKTAQTEELVNQKLEEANADAEREARIAEGLYGELTASEKAIIDAGKVETRQSLFETAKRQVLADASAGLKSGADSGTKPGINVQQQPVGAGAGHGLEAAIIPGAKQFYEQDIEPFLKNAAAGTAETAKLLVNLLDPTQGVNQAALDEIMSMKGTRDRLYYQLDAKTKDIETMFSKMKISDNVAFIDRVKLGKEQPTKDLQNIADMMRSIDDVQWNFAKEYAPSLGWLENHYRVLWKVIPGSEEGEGKNFLGVFKRPLQGTKGFMKPSTLEDMSTGLAAGGVPYTYNPMSMFKKAYEDTNKFITAQKMWATIKGMGLAEYVRAGAPAPASRVPLDDSIARTYYLTDIGTLQAGQYYIDDGVGRLLNNYLSKDNIRGTALGRGLMWIKNNSTAVELSLSPFHAVFESLEAMGSAVGVGLSKLYNRGLLQLDPKAAVEGLADIVMSPLAPYTTSKIGGKAIRFMSKDDFIGSEAGKYFLQQMPEIRSLLDDLFTGGGKLAIAEDYKLTSVKTFRESIANNNYIGATLRALPALNQVAFHPLFEVYIPRLKIGQFLREYTNNLQVYRDELASGKITRPQLARRTWQSVENRFGEMNFDNLFWNNSFKSAMQLMFRSVTWKLGSLKEYGSAGAGQAKEFYDAAREKRAPKLDPSMAWLLGVTVMTVALAQVIQKTLSGKNLSSQKDALFPQVDKLGSRVSMPTYWRDIFHLAHDPLGYLHAGFSGEIGRIMDVWQNKDFYGQEVYNFNDPLLTKMAKMAGHVVPLPFSVSSYQSFQKSGITGPAKYAGFAGFTKAPGYINQTQIQQDIFSLYQKRFGSAGAVPQQEFVKQQARSQIKSVLQQAITARKAGETQIATEKQQQAQQLIKDALKKGYLTQRGLGAFESNAKLAPDIRAFKRLPQSDQVSLMEKMKPEDLASYKRYASKSSIREYIENQREAANAGSRKNGA